MAEKSSHSLGKSSPDSFNSVDVYVDEPCDTTVRPCRPSLLEHSKAQREIIREALAAREAAAKAAEAKSEKTD